MRTKLTERDLSRIVKRVINEQDTVDNKYCDIDDDILKSLYDDSQSYIDTLIKSENIKNYDCDFHKHFVRQMSIGGLCNAWEQRFHTQLQTLLSNKDIDVRHVLMFLRSRYDI